MSKLSHIEDVERRAQQEQEREAQVSVPESASRPFHPMNRTGPRHRLRRKT